MPTGKKRTLTKLNANATAVQDLICKLTGVISAKIILNNKSEIEEVHILADFSKNPKQIVRDTISLIAASFDCHIDHKIISVAQVDDGLKLASNIRLQIKDIQVTSAGNSFKAVIILCQGNNCYIGEAECSLESQDKYSTIAKAVINAVHNFVSSDKLFDLAGVQKITMSEVKKECFLVVISSVSDFGEELLTGSSIVKYDENQAIIRATLDAVNRCLVRIHTKKTKTVGVTEV